MGYEWMDLPPEIRDGLLRSLQQLKSDMNPLDVSSTAWALGELDCPLDCCGNALDALLGACANNLSHMKGPELCKLLVVVAVTVVVLSIIFLIIIVVIIFIL